MRAWVASASAGPWFRAAVPDVHTAGTGVNVARAKPKRVVGGRAFVHAHVHLQIRVVVHGHDQRGVAGTWTCHDVANAKFDEHFRDDGRSGM